MNTDDGMAVLSIRIPLGLKKEMEVLAELDHRTLTSWVIANLARAVEASHDDEEATA